jgi:hypothetical protein
LRSGSTHMIIILAIRSHERKGTYKITCKCLNIWLPERDALQNFFAYNFGFRMVPLKKNHRRTEYLFQSVGITT